MTIIRSKSPVAGFSVAEKGHITIEKEAGIRAIGEKDIIKMKDKG